MHHTFAEIDPLEELINGSFEHLFDPHLRATELDRDAFLEDRYEDAKVNTASDTEQIELMLLMEAADAGLIELDVGCVRTSWGGEVREYPRNLFEDNTLRALGVVNLRTRNNGARILKLLNLDASLPREVKAMRAIEQLAFEAYETAAPRKDGTPYYMHAFDSAALLYWVMTEKDRELPAGQVWPRTLEVCGAVTDDLGHDVVEEYRKTTDYYSFNEQVRVYTPNLVQYLLLACGIRPTEAIHRANGMRLITHEKKENWMQSYVEYNVRLASHRSGVLGKIAEAHNNSVINEKPLPEIKEGESDADYMIRRALAQRKRDAKRVQQLDIVFGSLLTSAENPKNVFIDPNQKRFQKYGIGTLEGIRRTVVTDDLRERYPNQDFTGAVSLEEFKDRRLPEMRRRFIDDFGFPIRYPEYQKAA